MSFEEVAGIEEVNVWLKEYKIAKSKETKNQIKNLIVIACLPFVKKVSHGLARRSTDPVEDLIQVGSVGLLKAIENFDEEQGGSFKTYATYLITGEIRHYLRDKSNMIRAPRELQELSYRISQIVQKLSAQKGKAPSDIEIANELQIPVKKVSEITEVDRRKQMVSLDQVANANSENDSPLVDRIIDDKYQEFFSNREKRLMLNNALERLDDSLKTVIELSFFHDMNQNEIAQKLGVSQMQVSRRLRKALSELFIIIKKQEALYQKERQAK